MPLLAAMCLCTVPILFLYTFFIRFFRHIITPAVGGVVVLLVAITFVPISLDLWTGPEGQSMGAAWAHLTVGGVTAGVLVCLMLFSPPAVRLWSPLLAICAGYGTAAVTGLLHFQHASQAPWFGLPSPAAWPGIEWHLGAEHLSLLATFALAMLISVIEGTGTFMLVQRISLRDFRRVDYGRVQAGLYCDGLGKLASGLLGTAVPSTYSDTLPLMEMTGMASRKVGTYAAAVLLLLAFMPKASGVILDMPSPVMGGLCIVIVSMLFHAGFGLVAMTPLTSQNGLILGLSLSAGLVAESGHVFPALLPEALRPLMENGIALGGGTAFLLSLVIQLVPKRRITGAFKARMKALPELQALIRDNRERLNLSDAAYDALSLCCEEVFCHMVGQGDPEDAHRFLTLRTERREDGLFTEMVCGHKMDDVNNFALPDSLLKARAEDLQQLGMLLFATYAHDISHVEISGYSYISFYV